jgi:hypothetical protein
VYADELSGCGGARALRKVDVIGVTVLGMWPEIFTVA